MSLPIQKINDSGNIKTESSNFSIDYSFLCNLPSIQPQKKIVTASDKDADLLMELWVQHKVKLLIKQ